MSSAATFDWPPKALSPNARGHWSKRAKAVKTYRKDCYILALMQKLSVDWEGDIHVHLAFLPPDNRVRDKDNLQASTKALLDGMADALGVNDSRFFIYSTIGMCRKGGAVMVFLSNGV
jgi:crossover junction endodeoxyribonuclease RusA